MARRSLGKEMTLFGRNGGGTLTQTLEFVKATSMAVGRRVVFSGFDLDSAAPVQVRIESWNLGSIPLFTPLIGQIVVVDLKSTYVCLGTLVSCDELFLELRDADLHDFRDSTATREVYVYDSVRLGIRRNRARVLVRLDDVVAVTRFADIAAS